MGNDMSDFTQYLRDQELLALQRRQTEAAERQARGHDGDIVGLLILGLVIVGAVWFVVWLLSVIWRLGRRKKRTNTPELTGEERELLATVRDNDINPDTVNTAIRQTIERISR
jgi:hypothetical protein